MSRCEISNRITQICELIKKDIPYQEIQQRLAPLNSREIGNKAVINVQRALQPFPFIQKIEETIQNSKEDSVNKYDLIISLSGKNIDIVGVQVKSSLHEISKFYHKFNDDYYKTEKILIEKKIIVINGQLPVNTIQNLFLKKLSKIDKYYQSLSDCPPLEGQSEI